MDYQFYEPNLKKDRVYLCCLPPFAQITQSTYYKQEAACKDMPSILSAIKEKKFDQNSYSVTRFKCLCLISVPLRQAGNRALYQDSRSNKRHNRTKNSDEDSINTNDYFADPLASISFKNWSDTSS